LTHSRLLSGGCLEREDAHQAAERRDVREMGGRAATLARSLRTWLINLTSDEAKAGEY